MSEKCKRVYGRCRAECNGLGIYWDTDEQEYCYLNGDRHTAHPVDFLEDPSVATQAPKYLKCECGLRWLNDDSNYGKYREHAKTCTSEPDSDSKTTRDNNQATEVVALFLRQDVALFHDERKVAYARQAHGPPRMIRVRSMDCRRELAGLFYSEKGQVPGSESLNSSINVLEHMALNGPMRTLHTRVAYHDGAYWLDLADTFYRAIKITKEGWTMENHPPPIFRRHAQQAALPIPLGGGNPWRILDFLNVMDTDRGLILVDICVKLVPNIPHPIDVVYGPQGGAKTTFCELIKESIDPSVVATRSIPPNENELIQALDHNYITCFDNVGMLKDWVSDGLCRVTTGTGFSKRMLYTDDEDVIYSLQKPIMINGINVTAQRPDFLDRGILIRLPDIPDERRKSIQELRDEFELAKPALLGSLLDTFVKALNVPDPELDRKYRMADFLIWGYRFAEALGWSGKLFLEAYSQNVQRQAEESVQASPVIEILLEYLDDSSQAEWEGTPSLLLANLTVRATENKVVSTRQKAWPKSPTALSRVLNDFREPLRRIGYVVTTGLRDPKGNRMIRIEKQGVEGLSSTPSNQKPSNLSEAPSNASNPSNHAGNVLGKSLHAQGQMTIDAIDAFDTSSKNLPERLRLESKLVEDANEG